MGDDEQIMYTANEEALINYYSSTRCRRMSHALYFQRLVASARGDPACTYMLVAYAAAHRASTKPVHEQLEDRALSVEYKVRALNLMNSRIALAPGNSAGSDSNIQSALFLLAYENRFGDPAEARIHLDGLRRWVEQRGGLDAFEEHYSLGPQLRWIEMTGMAILILDCGPDCEDTLIISSLGVLDSITLNNTIVRVATVQLPDLCQMFFDFFGLFRSEAHYRIVRQIFRPAGHLSLVFASVLQDHPPRFLLPPLPEREDMLLAAGEAESSTAQNQPRAAVRRQLWSEVSSQCRVACLFFINACICTSHSRMEAESLLLEIVELTEKDYPTSDSTIGLLWTFAYAMQLENAANVEANRIVLQMLNAVRRLRPRSRAKIENLLVQLLFYPLEYDQIDGQVDELELYDEIMLASEVIAPAMSPPVGSAR